MIEQIQTVCALLAKSPLKVQQVAVELGTVIQDQGGSLPLIVRPEEGFFSEVIITRQFGTQLVAGVILKLAETAELAVESLRANFGEYSIQPAELEDLAPIIQFYLGEPAMPGSTSIIATLKPGQWENIAGGTVSELVLQPEF